MGFTDLLGKIGSIVGGIASPISTIANLGSSIFNTVSQNSTNKENMRFAREQSQLDRDFNAEQAQLNRDFQQQSIEQGQQFAVEQWNRENEYNDPSAIMQRYQKAGLNPNLVAGTIGGTGASLSPISSASGSTASSSSSAPSQVAPTLTFGDVQQRALDYERQRAEIDLIKSQKTGQDSQNDILATEASFRSAILTMKLNLDNSVILLNESSKNWTDEQIKKILPEIRNLNAHTNLFYQQMKEIAAHIDNMNADTAVKRIDEFFASSMYKAQIQKLMSEANLNYTQANDLVQTLVYRQLGLQSQVDLDRTQALALGAERNLVVSVDADGKMVYDFEKAKSFSETETTYKRAGMIIESLIEGFSGALFTFLGLRGLKKPPKVGFR